jgi:hypothetical protein
MKNRLLFLSIITILNLNTVNAQKIGINFSSNYTFYQVSEEFKPNAFVPGVGIGLTYRKALNGKYALLTGLDFQNFNYHLGLDQESATNVRESLTSRVINNMFQVPILIERRFNNQKFNPFLRLGVVINSIIPAGTTDKINSKIGSDITNNFDGPVSSSSEIYRTRLDDPFFGISPIIEIGTFGKIKQKDWDVSFSIVPIFDLPEYSMIYRINDTIGNIESPHRAILSHLKFRFYLK